MHIAIEIGGTKLQIARGNPKTGAIDQNFRFMVDRERGAAGILTQIETTLAALHEPIETIGLGFGGPVDRESGIIATSHQIDGWSGFNFRKWLHSRYKASVFIENDANTAALGEARFGAGKNFSHVFYITLGSGVGGGMVINKKLYLGSMPGEAEVGQMRMDKTGRTLESFCSGWALDARIRNEIAQLPVESPLRKLTKEVTSGEARFLLPAIKQNDPAAIQILKDYADTIAWGLSHVVHLFHPELIVIGGGVSLIGQVLIADIKRALPKYLMKTFLPGPRISLAALKENAVITGVLCLSDKTYA